MGWKTMCCGNMEILDNGEYSVHTRRRFHRRAWCAFVVVHGYGIVQRLVVVPHLTSVATLEASGNKVLHELNGHIERMLVERWAF